MAYRNIKVTKTRLALHKIWFDMKVDFMWAGNYMDMKKLIIFNILNPIVI